MKTTIVGIAAGTALMLSAGTALAGGSVKDGPMPAECCQANWNGLYIGAAAGYGIATTELDLTESWGYYEGETWVTGSERLFGIDGISSKGFQGTFSIGYDRQIHPGIVLGVFGDYTVGDLETTANLEYLRLNADITDTWAVGGRLGFVRSCCTMWFATVGYSQADLEWRVSYDGYPVGRGGKSLNGWFVGGGVEQALHNNLYLKLEYRYTNYDSVRLFSDGYSGEGGYERIDLNSDTDVHSIRLGVNWKFDLFHDRPAAPAPLK